MQGNSIIGEIYTWGEKNIKEEYVIANYQCEIYFSLFYNLQ